MLDTWEDVQHATLNIGDVVRVKVDAYAASGVGKTHNGRLMRVIDIKDGDVLVTSIDMKLPYIPAARHAMYRLEKKAREQ